jgi:uncharacterized cupredoxin-like copper-binding protein
MAAISHPESVTVAADGPQLERTFAMNVVSTGFAVITVGLIYLVILFLRAGDEFRASSLIPVFATITAIFAGLGTVSLVWSGARRHPWVWLVFALPAVLFLLMNATYLAYDITHPTFAEMFVRSLLLLAGGLAIILGSVVAFFEVRRGRPIWARPGPIGWGSMAVIGALVGAAITSILAAGSATGGIGVAEEPTVSGVLALEKNAFSDAEVEMRGGEVLGLFVANKDEFPHSFDIDSLDIHVQLPPSSTTAVTISPTGPGNLEFYCSIPGHRAAGMVGTLSVE